MSKAHKDACKGCGRTIYTDGPLGEVYCWDCKSPESETVAKAGVKSEMSKAKECWLTAMVVMLTANAAGGIVPSWLSLLLIVCASIEFIRGAYYFLFR